MTKKELEETLFEMWDEKIYLKIFLINTVTQQ